jgi:threonine/homoserine/homoserine lactone efflux protein
MGVEIASLIIFAASQIGTPGPANMTLLATGARFGLRRALPFVGGVALGKQLIIWPIGFGLMGLAAKVPMLFDALKWLSVAYICWLAWRVARMSLAPGQAIGAAPGFIAGLWVHPLNPKAWAMIVAAFSNFVAPGTSVFSATFVIALTLLGCQLVLHPLWCWGGQRLAATLSGTRYERALMLTLAALTVASVFYALFAGGRT